MRFQPRFSITPAVLKRVEAIAAWRERIQGAAVQVAWIPALQKVRAVEAGEALSVPARARREVVNYFAALRHVEKQAARNRIAHEDVLRLHRIVAGEVMDQGDAGRYRAMRVQVGEYMPPPPGEVPGLMLELLEWWNDGAPVLSPVLSCAIVHYRFEAIHPFADGNGRTGRALALWELYRRGFDTHHICSGRART